MYIIYIGYVGRGSGSLPASHFFFYKLSSLKKNIRDELGMIFTSESFEMNDGANGLNRQDLSNKLCQVIVPENFNSSSSSVFREMQFLNFFIFGQCCLATVVFLGQLNQPSRCAIYKFGLGYENKNPKLRALFGNLQNTFCLQKIAEMKSSSRWDVKLRNGKPVCIPVFCNMFFFINWFYFFACWFKNRKLYYTDNLYRSDK